MFYRENDRDRENDREDERDRDREGGESREEDRLHRSLHAQYRAVNLFVSVSHRCRALNRRLASGL